MSLPIALDAEHGLAVLGGESQVFHCHHYNCFLQKTVMDLPNLVPGAGRTFDTKKLLTQSAARVALSQFQQLSSPVAQIEEIFRNLGFGSIDLSPMGPTGGTVTVGASHYALGWLSRFGKSEGPVCFMAAGFVEAAARHLHGGNFQAVEVSCVARGDRTCQVTLSRGGEALGSSPGIGTLARFGARPAAATRTSVDEPAIINACAGLPLGGDAEGKIRAFGVALTRHYASYYNLISYQLEQEMAQRPGGALAARMLLTEAGLVCAFHTFGGIMESAEWEALIKPQCKTPEDWAYGMTAVVNALGWGRWSIADLVPNARLEMVVDGSYESNGYLKLYGKSDEPRCHLITGGTAGLMNLLYRANIAARPELTLDFYEKTFKGQHHFVAREVECRAMGASACRVVAEPLQT